MVLGASAAVVLAGCSSDEQTADISNLTQVKSFFSSDFRVTEVPKTGINPRMSVERIIASQKLPDGLTFEPPDCAKYVAAPQVPSNVEGNMTAMTAEGAGNRLITIALETNEPIEVVLPGDECQKVTFANPAVKGVVEVVPAPQIDGVNTIGVRRTLSSTGENPQTDEVYSYRAYFGRYQVMVTAKSLAEPNLAQPGRPDPNAPAVPVDAKRAEDLLVAAVAAVRS